jgi:Na+-translocating ferredoxin:NAD+ oxidoreductase RnfC subunit
MKFAGQRIAEASGFVSIHHHAPISGKITRSKSFPIPSVTSGGY